MRRTLFTFALLLAAIAAQESALAEPDLFSIEAEYVADFAAFTDWPPARPNKRHLLICVRPQSNVAAALEKLEGRFIAMRVCHLRYVAGRSDDIAGCDVLVVDGNGTFALRESPATGPDQPLLIIRTADAPEGPYVVRLFREDGRLRFDIDNGEALRRHLRLSSKLLRLARKVS
ncbi:YfiR family protein [Trinickia sp. EG282A]|uniref:YfiR family protein n=1 Tax=Trinickia sp. EG282A TaxID=3237013 RepID=UPI0034D1B0BA